jgi:hypothetical protein
MAEFEIISYNLPEGLRKNNKASVKAVRGSTNIELLLNEPTCFILCGVITQTITIQIFTTVDI